MNNKKILLVVLIVLLTNILTFFGASSISMVASDNDTMPEFPEDLQLFNEVLTILESEHLKEVDRNELLDGAFKGMLKELDDPATSYLDPDDYENLKVQTEGLYGGVGIEVFEEDGYVTVIAPISGTPGEKAGLSSGDRIISVDGINLVGEDLSKAVSLIRGKPGTALELEVERPGVDNVLKFDITREEIELETVEHEMLDQDLGYIRLTNFSTTSGQEMEEALDQLKEAGMVGLVIDLRNNPGGVLDAAVDIADKLVPEGPITHITRNEQIIETHESHSEGLNIPMVVLVNETSSSASEVLAGALQDTKTATIVGTQTFGKATVQNIRELSDSGALRYTVAQYQTPAGRTIHEKGLTPDIEVDPPYVAELAMMPISTSLEEGDEGEEVETMQKTLEALGYYDGEISGYFDQATAEALQEFQEEQGISVTGEMSEIVVIQFHEELQNLKKEQDNKLDRALELLKQELE